MLSRQYASARELPVDEVTHMTLYEQLLWRGLKAARAGAHAGFGSPGQFLAISLEEKLKVLAEPPHEKLPRMLDAADKEFWKQMNVQERNSRIY